MQDYAQYAPSPCVTWPVGLSVPWFRGGMSVLAVIMSAMGTTVLLKVETESEANAWASVFRSLGLEVGRPSNSPVVSGDGRWIVRACSRDDQQRQPGRTWTRPNEAS